MYVVEKVLCWLCGSTECGFGHLIVVICVVHNVGLCWW